MKRLISLVFLIIMGSVPAAAEEKYHPGDVAVVSNILKINDAEFGWLAREGWAIGRPETWPGLELKPTPDEVLVSSWFYPDLDRNSRPGVVWQDGRLAELKLNLAQLTGPVDLTGLTELRSLDLAHNKLTAIRGLSGLTALTELRLRGNQLEDIGDLGHLKNLRWLDLTGNRLGGGLDLGELKELRYLALAANRLTALPGLDQLVNLVNLDLARNQLTGLGDLGRLSRLQFLLVNDNRLTDLDGLAALTGLRTLMLNNNFLKPGFLGSLKLDGLEHFGFSGGQIPDFSLESGFGRLREIQLSGGAELRSLDLAGRELDGLAFTDYVAPGLVRRSGGLRSLVVAGDLHYRPAEMRTLRDQLRCKYLVAFSHQTPALGDAAAGLAAGRAYSPAELSPLLAADYAGGADRTRLYVFNHKDREIPLGHDSRTLPPEALDAFQGGRITFPEPGQYYLTLTTELVWHDDNDISDPTVFHYQDVFTVENP